MVVFSIFTESSLVHALSERRVNLSYYQQRIEQVSSHYQVEYAFSVTVTRSNPDIRGVQSGRLGGNIMLSVLPRHQRLRFPNILGFDSSERHQFPLQTTHVVLPDTVSTDDMRLRASALGCVWAEAKLFH